MCHTNVLVLVPPVPRRPYNIQNAPKTQFGQMEWRMPNNIRQGERIPYKCTSVGTTCSRETFDPILDNAWKVNGMRFGITWWNWMQRASHLLPEQEIHRLWVKVLIIGKDVLRASIDSSKTQAIHALPHHMAYCKIGPHQVYFWEAFIV